MWVAVHDNGKPVLINLQNALEIKQLENSCIESLDCIRAAIRDYEGGEL